MKSIGREYWDKISPEEKYWAQLRVRRHLSWLDKRYGIRRRLLEGQYKPTYRKAKNSNQARAIYLLERGINPDKKENS